MLQTFCPDSENLTSALTGHHVSPEERPLSAHLTAGIDLLEQVAGEGVPEPQLLIGRSTSAREDAMLMRIPGDRLDGCDVVREAV